MEREASELIHGYFDQTLSDDQAARLSIWIKESPENAKAFARVAMLHDRLQLEIAADSTELRRPAAESSSVGTHRRTWLAVAALAACFLGIVGFAAWRQREKNTSNRNTSNRVAIDPSDDISFASIARVVDVQWSDNRRFVQGERLDAERVSFASGVVRLQFDDGVEVTLEGPADYELIALGKTRLHTGLLSATVPPGAEGFRVDTPSARVIDLGTAFGIRLDDSGVAEVSVFDGLVDVVPHDSEETRRLKEGEAVRVSSSREIQRADFDIRPFEKLWPVSSGIAGSTGAFKFAPPWPRRLRLVTSDDHIFVVPEGYRQTLPESLDVNISRPGIYSQVSELTPETIPSNQQVRSFLLHFRPEQSGPGSRISGSITFDRPVLGLIVLQRELAASKKLFVPSGVDELRTQRQLELRGGAGGDSVQLSEDRRTVRLDLAVSRRFSDLVRVILDAGSIPPASDDQN